MEHNAPLICTFNSYIFKLNMKSTLQDEKKRNISEKEIYPNTVYLKILNINTYSDFYRDDGKLFSRRNYIMLLHRWKRNIGNFIQVILHRGNDWVWVEMLDWSLRIPIILDCSLTRLYTVGWPSSISHFDIPKNDNGQFQILKVGYSI